MLSIQQLKQNYKSDLNALVQRATHGLTIAVNASCTIIMKNHPNYKNVYVYSTDIDNFKSDGIYELIPQILPDSFHELRSIKLEKFGNITGTLYANSMRIHSPHGNSFVTCISEAKIDSFPENNIKEIEETVINCRYDFSTVLEHVSTFSQEDIDRFRSYKFSVEVLNTDSVFESIFSFFYSILKDTDIPVDWNEIIAFIVEAQSHYNNVPYHNWRHATDATQFVFYLITMPHVEEMLPPLDRFALLLSVICHDLEHNGHTNDYHRKVNSEFSQEAGPDLPPLENHHQKLAKVLIQKHLKYTLEHLTDEQKENMFRFITEIIFSTDMGKHKFYLEKIVANIGKFDGSIELRILTCQAIMKLADLSNTCRPFDDSCKMAKRLNDEWFIQGDDEKKLGLPISNGMDRDHPTPLPKGQIGFYKFCTQQLLEADQKFFGCFQDIGNQFFSNLSTWEKLASEL
ncbi:3'5'-cyclic nucleotide phosphodiesterase family protein [Trichomonas vaginalis G3]|uniref:Phosphodiesterase n=1 Tax=Trichomonas vaginalis (strain ATCC PRA-98 / G3) TaxID=412133 RepID=A2DM90_TRIV3|nr:3',5'-cyclic-nucleotide phosphodiesterase protein [Trichomonas vaginalis G3]EAY18510.1 3'5'-cyclic nucleotide phosphodiesterase family protein [Trichomonas vaginalis G3]KAI5489501.1 3',5'-cyclic-nucleotide phosphodiesterase protein [Trichomonas vaginalis G3]|eukprot:XP_001579496.1 3'5'-cyclic nucleotide phosphodiesterase family protein [Trichomonas vaginalis G3]